MALLVVGCGPGREDVECVDNTDCDLSTGGVCTLAATGNQWCAYPDPACPTGMRFSEQDVGDGLAGSCTDGPVAVKHTLTVAVGGSGSGAVTSTPTGLACASGTCTFEFAEGTQVALAASPSAGMFLGWSEGCSGAGTCAVTMDRDQTVAALFGMPGEALWSFQLGGTMTDGASAIAVDSQSNVYAAGAFQGSFMVGSTLLTSAGGSDIFVVKLSGASGDLLWVKSFGSSGEDGAVAIALDASDSVYIAGGFGGPIDFGGGVKTPVGSGDNFLVKLDSAGNHEWSTAFGGQFIDSATGLAVGGNSVVVAGSFSSSMTVGGQALTTTGTGGYAATFSTAGSFVRVKAFTGNGTCIVRSVAIDSASNVVVGGTFNGTIDLGNGNTTTNNFDVFVTKLGSTGTFLFGKTFGGSSKDNGGEVSVDGTDNILITGTFSGMVNFGGPSAVETNSNNLGVIKYSAAGSFRWAQVFGGTTSQLAATRSSSNAAGDVVVAGYFCGNLAFGSITMASVQACNFDLDMFAVRLAALDGTPLTATRNGGSSPDAASGVSQAANGQYFLAGHFSGFADFGGQARTSAGSADAIIVALAPL